MLRLGVDHQVWWLTCFLPSFSLWGEGENLKFSKEELTAPLSYVPSLFLSLLTLGLGVKPRLLHV